MSEALTPPRSLHWLGDRPSADATAHAQDELGCVMYFSSKDECLEFMRQLRGAAHDDFGVSRPISIGIADQPAKCSHWPGQPRCEVCGMGIAPIAGHRGEQS